MGTEQNVKSGSGLANTQNTNNTSEVYSIEFFFFSYVWYIVIHSFIYSNKDYFVEIFVSIYLASTTTGKHRHTIPKELTDKKAQKNVKNIN